MKKRGDGEADFPVFCPMTPGGKLAAKWKKVVEDVRMSIGGEVRRKVVEQGGLPLHSMMVKPLPRWEDSCDKVYCQPCQSGQTHQSCHQGALGGVGYELSEC